MAKFWAAGAVKTRLASRIGGEAAAEFQRLSLACLLQRLTCLECDRVVAFAPADRRHDFEALAGPNWEFEPQAQGDLGRRMQAWFEAGLAAGYRQQVLLGADSPNVPIEHIRQAFEMLATRGVVLGPSADGGYYLVGAAEATPPIFSGIDWSTPNVLAQTRLRLQEAGLPCGLLPEWYDVDEWADLSRLRADLAGDTASEGAVGPLRRWLAAVAPADAGEPDDGR